MPDSLMDLGQQQQQQQQQQVIPSGPTVSPQPFSTSGLADVLNLVIPAIVGSQISRPTASGQMQKGGGLGAMAGIGYGEEAMQEQRKRAQAYRQAEEENKYRQAITQQAEVNTQRVQMANVEARKRLANIDELMKGVTDPKERQKILDDPEQYVKDQVKLAHRPGAIAMISKATNGALSPEELMNYTDDQLQTAEGELLKRAVSGGGIPVVKTVRGPDGQSLTLMQQPNGTWTQLKDPNAELHYDTSTDNKTGKKTLTAYNKQGKPVWTADAGDAAPVKLTAKESDQLNTGETVIAEGKQALAQYDKILKKPALVRGFNLLTAQATGSSLDPDVQQFASTLASITNEKAHALFGARLTETEIARLSKQIPTLTTAAWNSEGFKTALDTTMDLYSKAMARQIATLKGERKNVPERLEKAFPVAEDDEYLHPDKAGKGDKGDKGDKGGGGFDPARIDAALQAGHPPEEIAAALKAKGIDPSQFPQLNRTPLEADTDKLRQRFVQP